MFQAFVKHAKSQKPLVSHAWRITTTLVQPVQGPDRPLLTNDTDLKEAQDLTDEDLTTYSSIGKFWLSSVYPIHRGFFNPRYVVPSVYDFPYRKFPNILRELSTEELKFRLLEYRPYYRDSGCIVEIGVKSKDDDFIKAEDVSEMIKTKLEEMDYKVPLTINSVDIFKIMGKPWMNDMTVPSPYTVLTVEIYNRTASIMPKLEEKLYNVMRRYGKIQNITVEDRSMKDNKPISMKVRFRRLPHAIAARNCLHGADFFELIGQPNSNEENSAIILNYQSFTASSIFKNSWNKHPRIFAVLITLLIASMTYSIVDPIRKMFIWIKLSTPSSLEHRNTIVSTSYHVLRSIGLSRLLPSNKDSVEFPHDSEKLMVQFLRREAPDTILYLTGPPGTGKSELAKRAITVHQTTNSIFLDFEEMCKPSEDEEFIKLFAHKVGFYPTFRVLESVGSLMDAVTPGAGKATMSTPAAKIQKVLQTMTSVFQHLAQDAKTPDKIPLIVIDGFADTHQVNHNALLSVVFNSIEFWVKFRLARVIFVGDSTFEATGGLNILLPNTKVEKIIFTDLPVSSAYDFIAKKTEQKQLTPEMEGAIKILGGRFGDMLTFINRINSGQTPSAAVDAIVSTAKEELRKILFEHKKISKEYSISQFWKMLTLLAAHPTVPYDFVLFSIFKGDDKALRSLIQTKLFSMEQNVETNKDTVCAGSPVIQRAFEEIHADELIRSGLDLYTDTSSYNSEEKALKEYEAELVNIHLAGTLIEDSIGGQLRIRFLLEKIARSQKKLEEYDHKILKNNDFFKHVPPPDYAEHH